MRENTALLGLISYYFRNNYSYQSKYLSDIEIQYDVTK